MGLDMYFTAKKTIMPGLAGDDGKEQQRFDTLASLTGLTEEDVDKFTGYKTAEVEFTIGYWRKFYDLHQWFVDNCGHGEDDCRPYGVGKESLKELQQSLETVLADPSTRFDYFPGDSAPDEGDDWDYFRREAELTVELIKYWLTSKFDSWYFIYQASW